MLTLLNRVAWGFQEALRPDRISGPGFMLCPFPDPLPKFPDSRPCLSSPRKRGPREARTGKQEQNPRETRSTRTSRIWVPAFAGMTKSAIVFWPQCEKLIKNLPTNSFKEPLLFRAFRGLHFGCGCAAQEIPGAFPEIVSL